MLPPPFSTVSLISWKWLGQQVESPDTLLLFLKTITNKMQAPISSWFLTSMRKSKNNAVRNPIHFETVCKKEVCGKDKVSFEHSKRRSAGGTDVIDIFNTKPARSKGLSAQSSLNHQVWSPPKGPLQKICFLNHKSELSTADFWILLQACKRVCLANRQGEQESCLFCNLDENSRKFSSGKGLSRVIVYQMFPG